MSSRALLARLGSAIPIATLVFVFVFGLVSLTRENPFEWPFEGPAPRADLPLPVPQIGDAVLAGRVLDEFGHPVPEVLVAAAPRGRLVWTHTAPDGGFRLTELDPGVLAVSLLAREFPPHVAEVTVADAGTEITLELPPRHPSPKTLKPRAMSDFHGRIDLAGDTLPGSTATDAGGAAVRAAEYESLEVALLPTGSYDRIGDVLPRRTLAQADGTYTFEDLLHGAYRILVLPEWAHGGSWPDLLTEWESFPVTTTHFAPNSTQPLVLTMRAGAIRGRLGRPEPALGRSAGALDVLEGALVLVGPAPLEGSDETSDPRVWPPVTSDPRGSFLVRHLPPGRYRVTVRAGETSITRDVTVFAQTIVDVEF